MVDKIKAFNDVINVVEQLEKVRKETITLRNMTDEILTSMPYQDFDMTIVNESLTEIFVALDEIDLDIADLVRKKDSEV